MEAREVGFTHFEGTVGVSKFLGGNVSLGMQQPLDTLARRRVEDPSTSQRLGIYSLAHTFLCFARISIIQPNHYWTKSRAISIEGHLSKDLGSVQEGEPQTRGEN